MKDDYIHHCRSGDREESWSSSLDKVYNRAGMLHFPSLSASASQPAGSQNRSLLLHAFSLLPSLNPVVFGEDSPLVYATYFWLLLMDQVQDATSSGQFARICVFCGSSSGKKSIYTAVAEQLGIELVRRGIDLVYGGGSIGLMGTVAQAAHDAGGHVVGVIPKALMPKEICGHTVGDLVAVDDMHQRKAEMARRADAFIALPGGFGTFEEVLEIITWAQLGIHKKPVGLLNVDGFYDAMLTLFDKALDEGFLNLASHNIVVSAPTAEELLEKLKNYAPIVDKSVPQLTWESTTGVSASSSCSSSAAIHGSNLHSNHSSTSGARASNTTQIRTRLATSNGVSGRNFGAGLGNLLLPNFQSPRAAGRFSVHSLTSPVYGFISRSGSNSVAVRVDCSAGASLGGARALLL